MSDFSIHNVELTAALMETCGRFLYLLPYTHQRMVEILETTARLRRAKNIDLRLQTVLEAAYFAVKPPERVARVSKVLTNVQKYIRFLLWEKLNSATVDEVIKSMRRLPWSVAGEAVEAHVLKASLRVARTKYVSIPNIADCLSGLYRYRPNLLVQLVDRILEEIQRSMDAPHKREPQRVLGLVRLLGELYNYSVVSAPVIYELLYTAINYGHMLETPPSTVAGSGLPPPTGATDLSTSSSSTSTSSTALPVTVGQAPNRYHPKVQIPSLILF